MTPSRPYLLRAFYAWIMDNHLTAHIVVDATFPRVEVPKQYVEGGRIVLNISNEAVLHLMLDNHYVSFEARFSGVPHKVYVPMQAITAIYAKENGRGRVFKAEDCEEDTPPPAATETSGSGGSKGKGKGKPHLTLVK
jgi:stringent starvation protein B